MLSVFEEMEEKLNLRFGNLENIKDRKNLLET